MIFCEIRTLLLNLRQQFEIDIQVHVVTCHFYFSVLNDLQNIECVDYM
jgi:hypothetical protein